MGMSMSVEDATGRAMCKICDKKIEKGMKAIHANGYRTSGFVHNPGIVIRASAGQM
jgi:hypothetical protein